MNVVLLFALVQVAVLASISLLSTVNKNVLSINNILVYRDMMPCSFSKGK